MAIPQGGVLQGDIEIVQQPSRTYRLDLKNGRVSGMTDGFDAVRQAVYKIIHTERFAYLIYDPSYGYEGRGLIGKDQLFVQSEIRRRVQEALLQDDRITGVEDLQIKFEGDEARVRFTVVSDYGTFDMEVTQNV